MDRALPPAPAPRATAPTATAPVLSLRGLHKAYQLGAHRVAALRGIDLDLHPGELLALTGPSGSGKSTLLNLAGLIDRPDAGVITLRGQAVGALSDTAAALLRRDAIGFVFQAFNLVPVMTAAENVELPLLLTGVPLAERRARVAAMLAAVGLAEHAGHRPDRLSGGQRQRVAIARALIKRPALVIADEPTASLDSVTADQVLELMREQGHAHGAAFLIASHDARLVTRCDRVVHLLDGHITASEGWSDIAASTSAASTSGASTSATTHRATTTPAVSAHTPPAGPTTPALELAAS